MTICYACTLCGKCGKFDKDSPLFVARSIPCLKCGAEVDTASGVCTSCGVVAFTPMGKMKLVSDNQSRTS